MVCMFRCIHVSTQNLHGIQTVNNNLPSDSTMSTAV